MALTNMRLVPFALFDVGRRCQRHAGRRAHHQTRIWFRLQPIGSGTVVSQEHGINGTDLARYAGITAREHNTARSCSLRRLRRFICRAHAALDKPRMIFRITRVKHAHQPCGALTVDARYRRRAAFAKNVLFVV